MKIIKPERIRIFAVIKNNDMNSVEFRTTVHDGIIEVPKNNSEKKNKEVKVIIMWDEQSEKKEVIEGTAKSNVPESLENKYNLQFAPEAIVVNKDKKYELKFPLLCSMDIEDGQVSIENKMLGIYVYGASYDEAVQKLSEEFDYVYNRYNELSDVQLTEEVIAIKSFLNHIVKK